MPFIVKYGGMKLEYNAYFMMLSEAMIECMSPVINEKEIEALKNRMLELPCLHQGLFPITEHYEVFHQLTHIAEGIPLAGLLKNFSSYAGERANSTVKSYLQKGGSNPLRRLMNRLFEEHIPESRKMFDFNLSEDYLVSENYQREFDKLKNDIYTTVKKSNKQSSSVDDSTTSSSSQLQLVYNPFRMLVYPSTMLRQQEEKIEWMTEFEGSCLLECLIFDIMKKTKNRLEACCKSTLFRLYCIYSEGEARWGPKVITFYTFLFVLRSIEKSERVEYKHERSYTQVDMTKLDELKDVREAMIVAQQAGNYWISHDKKDPEYSLLTHIWAIMKYNDSAMDMGHAALIYGTKFVGRGFSYRETDLASYENNPKHNLDQNWMIPKYYSSWIKYRTPYLLKSNYINDESKYYIRNPSDFSFALLNFCLKLSIPSEKLLNGIKIANVTTIEHHSESLWSYKDTASFYPKDPPAKSKTKLCYIPLNKQAGHQRTDLIFIPFTNVVGSRFGSIGFDYNDKPIMANSRKLNSLSTSLDNKLKSSFSKAYPVVEAARSLYLFPISPESESIMFHESNTEMYNM
jgi:hypothetical protein